jgi:hypothetical protein
VHRSSLIDKENSVGGISLQPHKTQIPSISKLNDDLQLQFPPIIRGSRP